jgi:spore cortex formation protein SpoVR/YcgB (stage V sporulation)
MKDFVIDSCKDWKFEDIVRVADLIEKENKETLNLDIYRNQIEIISSEQMLDAYSSVGLPVYYNHWSFGKNFILNDQMYKKGLQGLAYEIVINSDPCISYLMEENSLLMQTLVIAHAAIGHNHFFKSNYLFKQWTDASDILAYMEYAKKYVADCEEKYGFKEVETLLDAAHALSNLGINLYPKKRKLSMVEEDERKKNRWMEQEKDVSDLWNTLPSMSKDKLKKQIPEYKQKLNLPEENVLYFLEKWAPKLKTWQREILRIVRNISQYFYPQFQDKIMNEGCATYTHYKILHSMYDKGLITDGAMFEFYKSHSGVIFQPKLSQFNPYALGFAMMTDIERICNEPTEEDKEWFPLFAGCKDSTEVLKDAWANYKDETFIKQYLSPKLMRDFKMFEIKDDTELSYYRVENIQDERGYRNIRNSLGNQYNISNILPEIEIVDVDLFADRTLILKHISRNNILLKEDIKLVLQYLQQIWGYDVILNTYDDTKNYLVESFKVNEKGELRYDSPDNSIDVLY